MEFRAFRAYIDAVEEYLRVVKQGRIKAWKARGLAATASLCAVAALATLPATAQQGKERERPVSVSYERTFTPAGADPRLAAAFASRGPEARGYRFTPAASKDRPSQLRVAVRTSDSTKLTGNRSAESVTKAPATVSSLNPTSYNLGVAVGWKDFAVSSDVSKRDSVDPRIADRESALVGVSYNLKRFTGRVSVAADRDMNRVAPALRPTETYSLDVGGAVKITDRLAVTGGVRYRIDQDRIDDPGQQDNRRDSQAVYVGTAFKF